MQVSRPNCRFHRSFKIQIKGSFSNKELDNTMHWSLCNELLFCFVVRRFPKPQGPPLCSWHHGKVLNQYLCTKGDFVMLRLAMHNSLNFEIFITKNSLKINNNYFPTEIWGVLKWCYWKAFDAIGALRCFCNFQTFSMELLSFEYFLSLDIQ